MTIPELKNAIEFVFGGGCTATRAVEEIDRDLANIEQLALNAPGENFLIWRSLRKLRGLPCDTDPILLRTLDGQGMDEHEQWPDEASKYNEDLRKQLDENPPC